MATIEQRLETARLRLQQKQPRTAVKLLRGILRDEPNHFDAIRLLSNVAQAHDKHEMARDLIIRGLKIRPGHAKLRMNLGIALQKLKQVDEAIAEYERAIKLTPQDGLIHFHLGSAYFQKGLLNEAARSYQRAIHYRPQYTRAHYKLGDVLAAAGAHNAAILAYKKVIELEPRRDDAYVDVGNVLANAGKPKQAIAAFRKALELNPRSIGALNNLSNMLRDEGKFEAAAENMRFALSLAPTNPILYNGLGLALERLEQIDEAFASYRKALELSPNYANAHYNLASLHQEMAHFDEAEASYQRAIECDPKKPEPQFRQASLWLMKGDFLRAWPQYELRWKMQEARGNERQWKQPAWDGGPLDGKTILLHAEQGFGDTLQFVRFAKAVKQKGATVILECPGRLAPLMTSYQGIDRVVAKGAADFPEFDVQAALLSVPGLLGVSLDSIPAETPYLHPDPEKVAEWKDRIQSTPGLRIGIAWQGKKTYLRDFTRSIPLSEFLPLTEIPGVTLFSLQKGQGQDQLSSLGGRDNVVDLAPELDQGSAAFEDTAAVMKHLDLVITSDTSIPHLAGALGVPVWVALSYVAEWRWLLDRTDSPWYPTMRLFRQPARLDWPSTFAAIAEALRPLADARQAEQAAGGPAQ